MWVLVMLTYLCTYVMQCNIVNFIQTIFTVVILLCQMYPCCIQVLELMCWCWSELPNYRPDFSTVINVLKTDMFTRLLQSFQLTENEEQVTTSCIRYVQPRMLSSTSSSPDSSSSFVFSSNVSRNSNSTSEDSGIQVWYGTDAGKYGIVQFQNSGINKHEVSVHIQ